MNQLPLQGSIDWLGHRCRTHGGKGAIVSYILAKHWGKFRHSKNKKTLHKEGKKIPTRVVGSDPARVNMPVIFVHRSRDSTEYTVLTHIGVWV